MTYTYEIRESDLSVPEKFIALVMYGDDDHRSIVNVGTSDDFEELENWTKSTISSMECE